MPLAPLKPPSPLECGSGRTILVNRGWVPPSWRQEWDSRYAAQQAPGDVAVAGTAQGSEDPSSFVPRNEPAKGSWFWLDVPGIVSAARRPREWGKGGSRAFSTAARGAAARVGCRPARLQRGRCLQAERAPLPGPLPPPLRPQASACGLHPATPLLQVLQDGGTQGESPRAPAGPFPLPKHSDAVVRFSTMPEDHTGYAVMWGGISASTAWLAVRLLRTGR